jgi:hypothetical protein
MRVPVADASPVTVTPRLDGPLPDAVQRTVTVQVSLTARVTALQLSVVLVRPSVSPTAPDGSRSPCR